MPGPRSFCAASERRDVLGARKACKNRRKAEEDGTFSGLASEGRGMAGFVLPPADW